MNATTTMDLARATPLARSLALSAGVSLADRPGSGPEGRILMRDIEALTGVVQHRPATAARLSRAPDTATGADDLIPPDVLREAMARRMSDSFRDVPHFPLSVDIEIDALLALREHINATLAEDGVQASLHDWVIKAAAATLRRVPQANASYSPEGLILHHDIDIALAIEGGPITPIIHKANEKGVGEIARQTRALAERARECDLAPAECRGATFTISDLGMFGVKSFTSIIHEPQGAILSVGVAEQRPAVRGDALSIATVLTVTLTCDHRAMDGAVAAEWVRVFKSLMEEPIGLLL